MATKKTEVPEKTKKVVAKTTARKTVASNEAIRKKAEEIYHARVARGEHGTADDDWHLAEKLLSSEKKTPKKEVVKKPAVRKK